MYSLLLLLHHFGARVTSIAAVRIVLGPCLVGSTVYYCTVVLCR